MYTSHYYLRTTIEISKEIQEKIMLDVLGDIMRRNSELNGLFEGMAETGIGPVDVQADIEFLNLLKTKGITHFKDDKIIQSEGEGRDPQGTHFEWKVNVLFVSNEGL